jgi:PleD family two-component response regulator
MPKLKLRRIILALKALIEHVPRASASAGQVRTQEEGRSVQTLDEEFEKFLSREATIACVDDDPTALERLRMILAAGGFETIAISNLPTALDRIWERLPDLIILDPMMGNMRGLELCRQLRAHPETEHIPIVLHTTAAAPEEAGLYNCVCAKPVDSAALLLLVRTLLMVRP